MLYACNIDIISFTEGLAFKKLKPIKNIQSKRINSSKFEIRMLEKCTECFANSVHVL